MKVTFNYGISGYSGFCENAVYYYNPRLRQTIMRLYKYPKYVPVAEKMKVIMPNLKLIQPSVNYKRDFYSYWTTYCLLKEFQHKPAQCWYNLYIKMLFALARTDSRVDLTTLNRTQIFAQDLPCKSVRAAVEAGLLPEVPNYQMFNSEI